MTEGVLRFPDEFNAWWALLCGHPKCAMNYPTAASLASGKKFYYAALRDVPPGLLTAALVAVANRADYFPAPSEIRAMIEEMVGPKHPTALEAWGTVLRQITSGSAAPLDAIAKKCVEGMGGLKYIGQCETKGLEFLRTHFIQDYDKRISSEHRARITPETATRLALKCAPKVEIGDGK